MNEKIKYLTIGEMAKITGASPKALKYYEKIGILKPAFIHPDSSYRYYSLEQIYHVELIQFCIELDIPLKELTQFIDAEENIHYSSLLSHGKKIIQEKISTLQRGLQFIDEAEQEMELGEQYHQDPHFLTREMSEKLVYVIPYHPPLKSEDFYDKFSELSSELKVDKLNMFNFLEYGLLHEYFPSEENHYVFFVASEHIHHPSLATKVIPAGTYLCHQSETSEIDQAPKIFDEYFNIEEQNNVIEIEIFSDKYQISKPKKELRLLIKK